ncbi:MAG: response regulator [Gemmatimonadetes bacterium]|nr:response regulator [Gemmatimonadota bacterium]
MYTVLIVDDQQLFRDLARSMLHSSNAFSVVGDAADGRDALDLYDALRPDLVLMDVQMERMDGLEATRRIMQKDANANVLLTSMSGDPAYERLGRELGVMAFVPKRELRPSAIKEMLDQRAALIDAGRRAA